MLNVISTQSFGTTTDLLYDHCRFNFSITFIMLNTQPTTHNSTLIIIIIIQDSFYYIFQLQLTNFNNSRQLTTCKSKTSLCPQL